MASIVEERNDEYQDAWKKHGILCAIPFISVGLAHLLDVFPEAWFPWIMVLNKLLRALGSPKNPDHWLDIAGYATLVYNHLTKE